MIIMRNYDEDKEYGDDERYADDNMVRMTIWGILIVKIRKIIKQLEKAMKWSRNYIVFTGMHWE